MCSRSSDPFYIVGYYNQMGHATSWTHSIYPRSLVQFDILSNFLIKNGQDFLDNYLVSALTMFPFEGPRRNWREQSTRTIISISQYWNNILYIYLQVLHTRCPSSDQFYIINYYIKWVTTSWTHSTVQWKNTEGTSISAL